jgi:hypothetical protein
MILRRLLLLGPALTFALGAGACATTDDTPFEPVAPASTGGSVPDATGGEPGTTGGAGATGAVPGDTGGVPGATGGLPGSTGGVSGTPAAGEDGADCLWPAECNGGVCLNRRCACSVDCGGQCPPCNGEACAAVEPYCGAGLACETGTCVPYCLTDWRNSTAGPTCTVETQPDRAGCQLVLDCMLQHTCGPPNSTGCEECDSNVLSTGAVGNDIARTVYEALCP